MQLPERPRDAFGARSPPILIGRSCWLIHRAMFRRCPQPWCLTRQRTLHETVHQQDCQHLLLPPEKAKPDLQFNQPGNRDSASDVSRDVPYRLLQFCASRTPSVNTFSPPKGSEFSRSACSRPQSAIPHHSCSTTTPLATGQVPNHVQNCYDHAQHFLSTFSSVA